MAAVVEQQRAETLDGLRTALRVSVTWMSPAGEMTHWAIADAEVGDIDTAQAFLVYCVVRAWRDAAAGLGVDDVGLGRIVATALARGVGS